MINKHLIGHIHGKPGYPTVIAFGGIHGNEPAGVLALESVVETIKKESILFYGNFYAVKGNLRALQNNVRFVDKDLNRLWTRRQIKQLSRVNSESYSEKSEQQELYDLILSITSRSRGPFYFIDLHTTSAQSMPFITISDSLNNRKFSSKFHLPTILGIEEYLDGPLLSYFNEFGHISLGFEAGQHDEDISIENCQFFIWKTLVLSGCLDKRMVKNYSKLRRNFKLFSSSNFYHIKERYNIDSDEKFEMKKGYTNFQSIDKGDVLAYSNGIEIQAQNRGKVFMPLYQEQGKDGFFIIDRISKRWLVLSKILRKTYAHQLLRLLPGIKMVSKHTLRVNPKTALFLRNEIFHLFGYRKRIIRGNRLFFSKRDRATTAFH